MNLHLTSILNYKDEEHKKLHIFLIKLYNAFTEEDFKKHIDTAKKLIDYTATQYNKEPTYTAFKYIAEHWLKNTFVKLSCAEVKALVAKAKLMHVEGKSTDDYLVFCLSVIPSCKPNSKSDTPEAPKPKEKLTFEYLYEAKKA